MYTIGELADELNRQEWAVERMFRNRGYLKQNGSPRKWLIDEGLMDEDGMITEEGWSTFIDDLGYKNPKEEDEDDEDEDEYDEEDEDGDEDEDDELDEDEVKNVIRSELGDVDEEIVDALYAKLEEWIQTDEVENVEEGLDSIRSYFSLVQGALDEGHTLTYALSLISCLPDYDDFNVYQNLDESDILEDLESIFEAGGLSDAAIEFMRSEFSNGWDTAYPGNFISGVERYDEAYHKALEHYHNEERARQFAEDCYHRGSVADFADDFEDFAREYEPWICIGKSDDGYFDDGGSYDADSIISYCYDHGIDPNFGENDSPEISFWFSEPLTFYPEGWYEGED